MCASPGREDSHRARAGGRRDERLTEVRLQCHRDPAAERDDALLLALAEDGELPAAEVEVAYADAAELGASDAAVEQDEQRQAVARGPRAAEEQLVDVRGEERRCLPRRPRPADPRRGGEGDVALFLGPDPEGADDGRHLGAGARVAHRPRVDHLAEVLRRDLERLAVREQEAHAREDRLVVTDRRLRRAVFVPEPAQVATDKLAERRLAVRLVFHRLPDDPGGLTERQVARVRSCRAHLSKLSARLRLDRLCRQLEVELGGAWVRHGSTQGELGARVGKDRAQIARWERGAVEPSFETLRELVRACGFELNVSIGPAEADKAGEKVLRRKLRLSPQERFQELLKAAKR